MLGVVMVFWAGNSIVGRAMRDDVGPFTLSFMRWFIACLVLLPLAARKAWAERAIIRAGWLWIAILGGAGRGAVQCAAVQRPALYHRDERAAAAGLDPGDGAGGRPGAGRDQGPGAAGGGGAPVDAGGSSPSSCAAIWRRLPGCRSAGAMR
ncbi:EamA family transporter [Novosphingobium colocasiae]